MKKINLIPSILLVKRFLPCSFVILSSFFLISCAHVEKNKNHTANYIFIKSTPKAKIFVNGTYIGMTPNKKTPVDSGSLIELKAVGYQTSFVKLGAVKADSLSVTKASGHGRISISSKGLTISMKKKL